jgi:sialic acid synthase SpsE
MIDVLRPASPGAIAPYEIDQVVGTRAIVPLEMGQELRWTALGQA